MFSSAGGQAGRLLAVLLISYNYRTLYAQNHVTSLPGILFGNNTNKTIVQGSVFWLYCNIPTAVNCSTFWTKDSVEIAQNIPHIRVRNNFTAGGNRTRSLLVIDNVTAADKGCYRCCAMNETFALLNVVQANESGISNVSFTCGVNCTSNGNRIAAYLGISVALNFTAEVTNAELNSSDYTVLLLKDGRQINYLEVAKENSSIAAVYSISEVKLNHTGVYQVIYVINETICYGSTPVRLDTGCPEDLRSLSPTNIFLNVSEKLVLEVVSGGGYDSITWTRNNKPLFSSSNAKFFNFNEILLIESVSKMDFGDYQVSYNDSTLPVNFTVTLIDTTQIEISDSKINITEGSDYNISCNSTGSPVPTITWQLSDEGTLPVRFNRISTESHAHGLQVGFSVSTLLVIDARVSDSGRYWCFADNGMSRSRASIMLNVQSTINHRPIVVLVVSLLFIVLLMVSVVILISFIIHHKKRKKVKKSFGMSVRASIRYKSAVVASPRTSPSENIVAHSYCEFTEQDGANTQGESSSGEYCYTHVESARAYRHELEQIKRGNTMSSESSIYLAPGNSEKEIYSFLKKKRIINIKGNTMTVGAKLGSGEFGVVWQGEWKKDSTKTIQVALKTLMRNASRKDKVKFLQEAAIMAQFRHPNVVALYGVVDDRGELMLVVELLSKGDLYNYLLSLRPIGDVELHPATPHLLLQFSQQVTLGMSYLASTGFIHRDLAARNVLISESFICKIADFGMSRALKNEDCYKSSGGLIPLKWTAPEALHYKEYSTASDVWSYGCVLYEIWSLGHTPFEELKNADVLRIIDTGGRQAPPPGCPRKIYDVMMSCWSPKPKERPAFTDVLLALLEREKEVLFVPPEVTAVESKAATLGAPLKCGQRMYGMMQKRYLYN